MASSVASIVYLFDEEMGSILRLKQSVEARILYDVGKWCLSMFFIFRLHFIFQDTPGLRVSPWILGILIAMITFSLFAASIPTIGWLLDWWESHDIPLPNRERSAITNSIIVVVDVIVLFDFCKRLMTVVISQAKYDNSGGSRFTVDGSLMNTVTKSTLLDLIGVLSSCSLISYLAYLSANEISEPFVAGSLRCLDGMINTFCMFFVFGFTSPLYQRACKCCHVSIRKCCVRSTEMAVNRPSICEMTPEAVNMSSALHTTDVPSASVAAKTPDV